jgi:hypothetical protein
MSLTKPWLEIANLLSSSQKPDLKHTILLNVIFIWRKCKHYN